jgi:hypothetical protein
VACFWACAEKALISYRFCCKLEAMEVNVQVCNAITGLPLDRLSNPKLILAPQPRDSRERVQRQITVRKVHLLVVEERADFVCQHPL